MSAAPTETLIDAPVPVSVVEPIPLLETPVTDKFSYDGAGMTIIGSVYPVPALSTVNDKVPPAPTMADTAALAPLPDLSVTPIETGCLYPDPKERSFKYSNAVPEPT